MKPKPLQIVVVEWIDAQRWDIGVQDIYEVKNLKPIPCRIVGFLIEKTDDYIVLAQECWYEEEYDSYRVKYCHSIPMCSITKILDLEVSQK